jgi:hypothetical protein
MIHRKKMCGNFRFFLKNFGGIDSGIEILKKCKRKPGIPKLCVAKKNYRENCQNFPFSNCQNFPFQIVKIFLSKLSTFSFSNCQNFAF